MPIAVTIEIPDVGGATARARMAGVETAPVHVPPVIAIVTLDSGRTLRRLLNVASIAQEGNVGGPGRIGEAKENRVEILVGGVRNLNMIARHPHVIGQIPPRPIRIWPAKRCIKHAQAGVSHRVHVARVGKARAIGIDNFIARTCKQFVVRSIAADDLRTFLDIAQFHIAHAPVKGPMLVSRIRVIRVLLEVIDVMPAVVVPGINQRCPADLTLIAGRT